MTVSLSIKTRTKKDDPQAMRREGLLPAVMYGPKNDTQSISMATAEFQKIWKEAGESTVVTLVDGDKKYDSLIQDVAFDSVKGTPLHADFYLIDKNKEVEVSVPIEFEGVSLAEKQLGGVLIKVLHEVDIKAIPAKLPHELKVDISVLDNFDKQIHASDIVLPEGVILITEPGEVVALVQEHKEEVEEAPAVIDLDSIEVEKKGKAEDTATEGEPSADNSKAE